ncbi:MAG: penicillin-binding protein 2 [Chthoniobacterales bacterium]
MKNFSPAVLVSLIAIHSLHGQTAPALQPPAPAIVPAWETRALAGNYELNIPAPRGQISDRNGTPLAQTRLGYNLGLKFTPPLTMKDPEIVAYARRQAAIAQTLIGGEVTFDETALIKHYRNRGVLPFELARNLPEAVSDRLKKQLPTGFVLLPNYFRIYPNGKLAAHVIGYAGRQGHIQTGPIDNGEKLWPEVEGRDGLEQAFNTQLTGQAGMTKVVFDKNGSKVSDNIAMPPNPGYNVVTSLDANIQKLAEDALEKGCKRGAMVILDPNNGDILAMASWPSYNPNDFIPTIAPKDFDRYNKDINIPLLPRAFRSSYPPGSTFKVITGLAALESGSIDPGDNFDCPAALTVGNTVMRNWKKKDSGSLDFMQALTQSCNTWFYQVGMKTGSKTIIDYASRLGIGKKTGVPLGSETNGRLPNDEYMTKVYKRKMLNGDTANMAIGQGDLQISPLQMAQAMMAVGNGGTVFQPRLVLQIQTPDNKVVNAYGPRAKAKIEIRPDVQKLLKAAMINVVSGAAGTAHQAAVPGIEVAGKTGTAQWGPTKKQRTAAWFAGFAPATNPKYAFAVVYEGEINNNNVHGGTQAAPLIGKVLRQLFAEEKKASDAKDKQDKQDKKDQADDDAKKPAKDEAPDEE